MAKTNHTGKVCILCTEPIGFGETYLSGPHRSEDVYRHVRCIHERNGAAVAFGLMGMAEAIQQRQRMRCYHPVSALGCTWCP